MPGQVQYHESPFPNTIRIVHDFEVGTAKLWGFRTFWSYNPTQSVPSFADMTALAQLASNSWANHCAAMTHPQVVLRNTIATDLTTPSSAMGEHGSATAGTRAGGALTPAATALINYIIQTRYRGGKGRTNLPFGIETDVDPTGASWTTAAQTAFSSAFSSYRSDILASTNATFICQIVASYFKGSQPNTSPSVWAPKYVPLPRVDSSGKPAPVAYAVTGWSLNPRISHQERRASLG